MQYIARGLKSIILNIDLYITILVAIYATYLGAVGGKVEYSIAAIALAISITAFSQFKERTGKGKLSDSIKSLEATANKLLSGLTADEFFTTASPEDQYIKDSRKTILMVQETGQLLAERQRDQLVNFLRKGGTVEVILVLNTEDITKLMAFRNKQLYTPELMSQRMTNGLNTFNVLRKEAEDFSERLEVRFLRYPIDFTAVFSDPLSNITTERKAIIRLQGFKVPFNNKLDFQVNATSSKKTFDAYLYQAERMWNLANRCTLLIGPSRIGKTSSLKKLCEKLSNDEEFKVAGFITEEALNERGERIGFDVQIVKGSAKYRVASKETNGAYRLESQTMQDVVVPELQKGIIMADGIFILDEIGLIQAESTQFRELVVKLIDNCRLSIIGTISNENHTYFRHIRTHVRVGLLEINTDNRASMADRLYKEIKQ